MIQDAESIAAWSVVNRIGNRCATAQLIDPITRRSNLAQLLRASFLHLYRSYGDASIWRLHWFRDLYGRRPAGNSGTVGQRGFFSDQSGVIRFTITGAASTIASPPLQCLVSSATE